MSHATHVPFRRTAGRRLRGPPAASWAEQARKAEDLGYSTLLMPDHFGDQLAPVPAMMAAADATTTLRVGALVFDNDYRHPLVLAKEAATLDLLSGGRLELSLGAGWMRTDYEQSGIGYDPPAVRVDRFEEAVTVVKGLLGSRGALLVLRPPLHRSPSTTPRPARSSAPIPRSSWAAAAAGCSRSPGARPTS